MMATREGQSCFLRRNDKKRYKGTTKNTRIFKILTVMIKQQENERTSLIKIFNESSNDNVGVLPHKISEASGQVHCGWAATQHRQDALEVEELQELMPAGVQMNT